MVDDNCIEYIGHSSCIVNMAVLPGFVYTPTPPVNYHDDTSSGGSSGVISRRNSDDFLSKLSSNHNQAFNSMNSTLALLTDGLTGNASKIAGEGINKSSNEVGLLKSSTSSARICKEEKMFFSCGADGVIRCWDEFLKGEQYQFKYTATNMNANGNTKAGNMNSNNTIVSNYSNVTKSTKTGKSTKKSITFSKDTVRLPATVKSNAESQKPSRKNSYHGQITSHHIEITCMLMMWEYNAIVTGSEDGIVCVWDADLGSKIMSKALTCAVTAVITAKTKRCDVLVAADISGAMAMWNLTLFKRNRTNLVVDSVTENSFHSPEEPGILCLAFHHQMKVMFSGGQDGTIRYWRLAHDSEANTLLRPHESDPPHSAIYHHRERRHRQMKAKYGENYATGLEEMSSTVSCPSGLLTNTESVQNYRQERNSFVTVEPINSLVCTDDFLLSGDGSGEIVLWFVIPIEHSEDIHGGMLSPHSHKTTTTGHGSLGENALPILNPEDAVNDYLNRKFNQDAFQNIGVENSSVAPFMMIIPMCRWFGNVQNPMKSILTMEQVCSL